MSSGRNDIRLIELKDTISQLNQTIRVQTEMIKDLRKAIEEHHASDEKKDQIISNLQAEISYLKAKLFGASSEKRRKEDLPGQMSLFDELMEEEPAKEIEPEYIEIKAHERKRKKKPDFNEQFRDIPVRQEFVDTLTEEQKICSICGTKMVEIGHELIRSEVIFTPAKLERVEYIATTYGCPKCKETEEPQFVKDNGIPALLRGSYVSPSLAAHVICQKFMNAMPLYRQEKDWEQLGATITRASMARWIIHCSKTYFQPMYEYFEKQLKKRKFLMMDETRLQVLKEERRRAQTQSFIWVVRSGEDGLPKIVLYHYTETRAGKHAVGFLDGIKPGYYFMADGYHGYNLLRMENAAVVMHISADIFWKRSRKVMKKIIQILPFREFCIVISCLNMNGVIVKKGFLRNKKRNDVSKMKNQSLRLFCHGLMHRHLSKEVVLTRL